MSGGGGGGGMSGGSGTASSRRCGCIPPRPSTRGIARHCAMLLGGASWALGSPGVQQRCCGDCATLNHLLNPCGSQTAHPFAPVSVQVRMTKTPPLAMASSSKLLLLFTMLSDCRASWTIDESVQYAQQWKSITSSSDFTKLAAVAFGSNIWTSADSGGTWTEDTSVRAGKHAEWTSITSSSDGTKLAAVVFQGNIWTSEELRPPPPPPPLAPYEGSNNDPLWIAAWVVVVGLMISLLFAGVVKYPWLFKRLLHYLKKMIAKWVERIMRFGTIYTSDPRGNATVAPAA